MDQESEEDKRWNESKQSAFTFDDFDDDHWKFGNNGGDFFSSSSSTTAKKSPITNKDYESVTEALKFSLPDTLPPSLPTGDGDRRLDSVVSRLVKHNKLRLLQRKEGSSAMISAIFQGSRHLISSLKSKEDKITFLDAAIDRHDGDYITAAVLHIKKTLSPRLFHQEMRERNEAIDSYINYLRVTEQTDSLTDFLSMVARHEEAAMTKLKHAMSVEGMEGRKRAIVNCSTNYFSASSLASSMTFKSDLMTFWLSLLSDEVSLLERQLPIEEEDKRVENQPVCEANTKFVEVPRKCLLGLSVITTLFYCCLYHFDLPENYLASPLSIKKAFNISDRQFAWTALMALSMRKKWDSIDGIFQAKSWLGVRKLKGDIDFDSVCRILLKYSAPVDMVTKYAMAIEDVESRVEFARQHNLTKVLKASSNVAK